MASDKRLGDTNGGKYDNGSKSILKPLDQAIITALVILVCSLLGWIAYTSYQNSVGIAELNAKFESTKVERDLSMVYIERRLERLEHKLEREGR